MKHYVKNYICVGAWVAQSVECTTLAQVMISQFMGSSLCPGFALIAQILLWILCLPLCPFPSSMLALSLSLSKINIKKIKKKELYL